MKKEKINKIVGLAYLVIVAEFAIGFVEAQDSDCDFEQYVGPGETRYVSKTYSAGKVCRYFVYTTEGYIIKLDCTIDMPWSQNCNGDHMLVLKSGDPLLTAADAYCGTGTISVLSTNNTCCFGSMSVYNSPGGSYSCAVTSQASGPSAQACICGVRKTSRIVGGQETLPNEYTVMAGFIDNTESIYCGGTIVSETCVITAAHCANPFRNNPGALSVVVNAHDIDVAINGPRYSIVEFVVHEYYNPQSFDYDVALARLALAIVFSATVSPVCLPFKFVNTDMTGKPVTLLGWGTTSFGGPTSQRLRKVDVTVISQASCQSTEGSNIGPRQLCTYTPGKDACQYDSGGPVIYQDPSNGFLFFMATISNGKMCATDHPGIHTRITALLQWIVDHVNAQLCNIK